MPPTQLVQCNPYKGVNPRCWVRLRFAAADGSLHERELLADTGCPCAVILGQGDLSLLMRSGASAINSNFGPLSGAWLELHMPELGRPNNSWVMEATGCYRLCKPIALISQAGPGCRSCE